MASLAELRVKIGGIRSTQQITKAMKMIAGARLARAQKHAQDAANFACRLQDIFYSSVYGAGGSSNREEGPGGRWRGFQKGVQSNDCALLLVTSDKGLCGGFNNSILHAADEFIKGRAHAGSVSLFVVGRKAKEYCQRNTITPAASYTNVFSSLDREQVSRIGIELVKHCEEMGITRMAALYNKSKSIMRQVPTQDELWPLPEPAPVEQGLIPQALAVRACEPSPEAVFDEFFPLYIQARIRQVLSASYASELAARMTAMDSASRNAQKLIDEFTLTMNNVRQSGITRELSEIIGASEVLK